MAWCPAARRGDAQIYVFYAVRARLFRVLCSVTVQTFAQGPAASAIAAPPAPALSLGGFHFGGGFFSIINNIIYIYEYYVI